LRETHLPPYFKKEELVILHLKPSILLALNFVALGAFAQDETLPIEQYLVTGTRMESLPSGGYSQITRAQVEQINPTSTLDLLRRVPNIIVSENGDDGGLSFVSIRGGESNFTLILIDGITVNDPTNSRGGGFDFNQLDPAAIERVEIYRGGISAIYGGEAISGVIQFITRQTSDNIISLGAGNQKQANANLTLSNQYNDNVQSLISLSSRQREASEFSEYQNNQALLSLKYDDEVSRHSLLVSFSEQENKAFAEDSGGLLFAQPKETENRESEQWLVGVASSINVLDNLNVNSNLSWMRHTEDSDHPGIAEGTLSGIPPSLITSKYERAEAEVYLNWAISPIWTLVAGVNGRNARGANTGTLDFGFPLPVDFKLKQDIYSLFTETKINFKELSFDIGIRYDKPDEFDNETSFRVSARYQPNNEISTFAVYNQGFKLPSFFALAHPLIGNPELKPERSDNIELGIQYSSPNQYQFLLSYFNNQFSDLVDFDPVLFTSINRSKVDTSGIEFNGELPIMNNLSMSFDISYLDVDIKNSDDTLRRRPKWFGGVSIDTSWNSFHLSIFADFRDRYTDSSIPSGEVILSGYAKFGLSGNWQTSDDLTIYVRINNLLNKEHQESVGFLQDEMSWHTGLRYNF
jgi:iron complex outermembrane receptor protein/vitamin B12 transporter